MGRFAAKEGGEGVILSLSMTKSLSPKPSTSPQAKPP